MDQLLELLLKLLLELLLVLVLLLLLLLYVSYHELPVHIGGRAAPLPPYTSIRRFSDGASDRPARVRSSPGCVSLPRAPCCVRLAKKYALCWLRCALAPFLRSNLAVGPRFCSLGRSPGLDLPCLNDRFAGSHAARARVTRTSSNSVKTPLKLSRNACRPVCAKRHGRRKKRRQRASRRMLRDSCVRFSCQRVLAAFRCVPGGSPDSVGASRGAPGAPMEPPARVMARLQSVPRTSQDGLRWFLLARLGAQRRFGAPGPRFWLVRGSPRGLLGRLSRSIFARLGIARYALPSRVRQRSTNKTQNKKRGAFAFVLRLAARARLRDFHDFSHDLRAHVLLVAPR